MENGKAIITSEINATLLDLQNAEGVAEMYIMTLSRIFKAVLHNQDELGMSDTEAVSTLRVLDMLRQDLVTLSQFASRVENLEKVEEAEEPKE